MCIAPHLGFSVWLKVFHVLPLNLEYDLLQPLYHFLKHKFNTQNICSSTVYTRVTVYSLVYYRATVFSTSRSFLFSFQPARPPRKSHVYQLQIYDFGNSFLNWRIVFENLFFFPSCFLLLLPQPSSLFFDRILKGLFRVFSIFHLHRGNTYNEENEEHRRYAPPFPPHLSKSKEKHSNPSQRPLNYINLFPFNLDVLFWYKNRRSVCAGGVRGQQKGMENATV